MRKNRRERRARLWPARYHRPVADCKQYGRITVPWHRPGSPVEFARRLTKHMQRATAAMVRDLRQTLSGGLIWSLRVRAFRRSLRRHWRGR